MNLWKGRRQLSMKDLILKCDEHELVMTQVSSHMGKPPKCGLWFWPYTMVKSFDAWSLSPCPPEESCRGNSVTSTASNNNLSGPSNVSHTSANPSQSWAWLLFTHWPVLGLPVITSLPSSSGLPLLCTSSTCRTLGWDDEGTWGMMEGVSEWNWLEVMYGLSRETWWQAISLAQEGRSSSYRDCSGQALMMVYGASYQGMNLVKFPWAWVALYSCQMCHVSRRTLSPTLNWGSAWQCLFACTACQCFAINKLSLASPSSNSIHQAAACHSSSVRTRNF